MLYRFRGGTDGAAPGGTLAFDTQGNLYDAASNGGLKSCNPDSGGCGTVFEIATNGKFSLLYTFQGGSDGAFPEGVTFDQAGNLFGGTHGGGGFVKVCPMGCGTSFELTPGSGGWSETILHAFSGGSDGGYPNPVPVFDAAGNLYGTTALGGAGGCGAGCGVIFELTDGSSGWKENVLYAFQSYEDGWAPSTGVVFDASGNLYGVAQSETYGLVYELTPTSKRWVEKVLYSFPGGAHGGVPYRVLLDAAGNIYGTTNEGGYNKNRFCGNDGCGLVYEIIR